MLCAVCLSMFSGDEVEGTHHTCLNNLQRAVEGGCKICIALVLRRDKLGPDPEAEETASPFLQYHWKPRRKQLRSKGVWEIRFDSSIRWLNWGTLPWNRIDIHAAHTDEPVPEWYLDVSKLAASDLDSHPWRVRRELFPLRPIPDNTGHKHVLDIAKIWLKNCETDHNCEALRTQSTFDHEWHPKRLIDIANTAVPRLLEPHLELPGRRYRYATLSHCWGANPDFITLTTENLSQFCRGIAIDILPKSFRDAILVCSHLDIRYIWIDSLCILQDSHPDWLLHAAEMSSVYQNCYLNLSLDAAENPRQGAFMRRNTDVLQDCFAFSTIPRDLDQGDMGRADSSGSGSDSAGSGSDDISDAPHSDKESNKSGPAETGFSEGDSLKEKTDVLRCLVFAPDLDYSLGNAQNLPLSKRGWVIQERLLSPRVLHFIDDRIRWECENESSLQEGLPHGLPETGDSFDQYAKHSFNCFPERSPERSQWDHFNHWEDIVRMYSDCLLTYPEKDKLVALAAVAQRFAVVFGEDYYAGHFRGNMPFDLAWEVLRRRSGQDSSTRRYPTWSWTSVDAEVTASSIWCNLRQSLAIVEDVDVVLEDPSFRYGPVKAGQLILRCLLVNCELGTRRDSFEEHDDDDIRRVHLQEAVGCEKTAVWTDLIVKMDVDEKEVLNEAFLIPLVERPKNGRRYPRAIMGMILMKQTDGCYRRVGYWDSDLGDYFGLENEPLFDYIDRYSQNHQRVVIV